MLAETVYTVFLSLPDGEKERLYAMMEKQKQERPLKLTKKSKVWTVAECMEVVFPLMKQRRNNRIEVSRSNLRVIK